MRVKCPHCGREFSLKLPKGKGAWYASEIKDLSPTHYKILETLLELNLRTGAVSKEELRKALELRGVRISGNALSGRLSELLGLELVGVEYVRVKVQDEKTKKFRFKRKPLWYVTVEGRRLIAH